MSATTDGGASVTDAAGEPARYPEALARYHAGDYAGARELLETCVVERPAHLASYLALGDCLVRLGEPGPAERAFRAGLRHDPADRALLVELARHLAAQQRHADAIAEYEHCLTVHPQDTQLADELAVVRRRLHAASAPGDQAVRPAAYRSAPAQPAAAPNGNLPAGMAVPPPALKGSLSAILNSATEAPDALDTRGRRLYWGHRRLLSHRRLWLAVAALPLLLYLGWQARTARQVAEQVETPLLLAAAQAGVRGTYLLIALVGAAAALGLGTAALNAWLSHYAVYERQVESCTGVFFRRRRVVWLFETTEVQFEQRPHHLLAGSATLVFYTGQTALTGLKTNRLWGARRPAELNGFGSAAFLRRLHDLLLNTIVQERYSMKRQFI